jgi:hypothetical protein
MARFFLKKLNPKRTAVLILIIASFLAVICLARQTLSGNSYSIQADYGQVIGAVNLDYGLNEEANWVDFADEANIHSFHREAGSRFIRVWLDDPTHRKNSSTIPYKGGVYDFQNLDRFINAVLDSDALPFVVFAYAPEELSQGNGLGNANLPINNTIFAQYCAAIVSHYKEMCEKGQFAKKCDISQWYWEIWNEPYWDYWWTNSTYINLYNEAYTKIKEVAPDTNVGGYADGFRTDEDRLRTRWFLENAKGLDFISVHIYGNYPIPKLKDEIFIENLGNAYLREFYNEEMIDNNRLQFYEDLKQLQEYTETYGNKGGTQIIVSELGPNWNWKYEPYLDEPFVSAWYASALNWMIRANAVDKELYYSGTSNMQDGGFAMWSIDRSSSSFDLFPVFYMKRDFARYNPKGSLVYATDSRNNALEILAVSNEKGRYLTIINRRSASLKDVRIKVENLDYSKAIDLKSGESLAQLSIDLEPYEVRFIQLI